MSTLTLVRQSELRIGGTIGAGAFGTVYQVKYMEGRSVIAEELMTLILHRECGFLKG